MVILDRELIVNEALKLTTTTMANGAMRVAVHSQELLFTFRVVPDSPAGIRLEQFQPEDAGLRWPTWTGAALQAILAHMDWQYVVALYPSPWQDIFESLGFRYLSERIRWEMALEPGRAQMHMLQDGTQIRPVTASAERLGKLLFAAENTSAIPLARCITLCRDMLDGVYGPLIAQGCGEIWMQHEPVGACLFTDYYGEALLAHIFLEHTLQGKKLASTLLRHCLNGLALAGYSQAFASTDAANLSSRRMHAQAGFREVNPALNCSLLKKADKKKEEAR